MKKLVSVIAFIALVTISQAQNWKGNGSAGFGILNAKARLQYEMSLSSQFSVGADVNWYFVNWTGPIIEPFARVYGKSGNDKGFFGQFKLGYGSLSVLDDELLKTDVKRWSTFGAGIGCGYKFLIGSHFTIEPYFGVRLYSGPTYSINTSNSYFNAGASVGETIGWYVTTGLPVEFNWKVGYQF